ncbi:MAG: DUF2207 domain-containing protein [Saprospiraceae bacterium]|nr:DUF2207 domain-containing protein [Saprospiraceae bacterium]
MKVKTRLVSFILVFSHMVLFSQGYYIKNYDIDIKLNQSGWVDVKETILVDFTEQRRGILRFIPYRYKVEGGEVVDFKISDAVVKDYKYDTYREGSNFVFKIGDKDVYITGEHQYELSYKMKKPYIFHEDFTEFYYNIIGTQWDTHIEAANFTVNFDDYISLQPSDYKAFIGAFGSTEAITDLNYGRNKISGKVPRRLEAGEGLTFAVKLPVSAIAPPTPMEIWWKKYGPLSVAMAFGSFFIGVFYYLWNKYGKDYPIIKAARFTPPTGLNPSEAGTIIDEKADNVDIMALLPYWAHNGLLKIIRHEQKWSKDDYELVKICNLDADAKVYEQIIFNRLFRDGDSVRTSDLKEEFYTSLGAAKSNLQEDIKSRMYYPISRKMQIVTGLLSFFALAIGIVLCLVLESVFPAIGLGIAAIVGIFFTIYMLKKNEVGVHLYQETLGFKMFIQKADKDRLERMLKDDPMYFEKTLPYAMVFGYTKDWTKKFDGLLTTPPTWYTTSGMGMHAFSPTEFGQSFDSGVKDIQSAFSSMPASSGGGGGGGGGFSGGGFGGGGGSSW